MAALGTVNVGSVTVTTEHPDFLRARGLLLPLRLDGKLRRPVGEKWSGASAHLASKPVSATRLAGYPGC